MTKRRVQGGEATSERRRRDGVYQKSYKRAFHPLIYLPLSPRGDRCEHTSPTVRQLLNHGYRFETLKRRLGFAAVPCQAMANLAVGVWVRVWVRTWRDRVILAIYCSNTSSVAVNRATFSHWRRLIVISVSVQTPPTPAMHFQRACRQCVHESARLFRVICSHAWYV